MLLSFADPGTVVVTPSRDGAITTQLQPPDRQSPVRSRARRVAGDRRRHAGSELVGHRALAARRCAGRGHHPVLQRQHRLTAPTSTQRASVRFTFDVPRRHSEVLGRGESCR